MLLSAWVTVGLASGIAHADDPKSSGSDASSESSAGAAPKTPKTPKTPKAAKGDAPKGDAPKGDAPKGDAPKGDAPVTDPDRKPDGLTPDRATDRTATPDATTASSPSGGTATSQETVGCSEPFGVNVEPPTSAADADADFSDPLEPRARRSPGRPGSTTVSAIPARPISADPQPAVNGATDSPRAAAHVQQRPTQASRQLSAVANVAPTGTLASSSQSGAHTVHLPDPRVLVGLVSDAGALAMSAVYTAATTVAQAFGPHSFLGVPYALATAVANTAALASRALIGAPLDAASTGPFPVNYGIIDLLNFFTPQQPPPGANDSLIGVTAEHPLPIILLNGTTATQGTNWAVGAPVLANAGYKVYTFNYGNITGDPNFPIQATDDIRQSGLQLAAEVDRVLAETGAPKVILIGHSQGGGLLPEYYINDLGGDEKVSQLIGIAPSNHGLDVNGLIGLQYLPILGPLVVGVVNAIGPGLMQQTLGADFQQEVYGDGDTRPGVLYTTVTSMYDEAATPYTQQALHGPDVTNIVLQDQYPGLPLGHVGMVLSPQVWSVVLNALASNPQANPLTDPLQSQELVA